MLRELRIPELALVLLVGVSGPGKSGFAARHFAPTKVLCADHFQGDREQRSGHPRRHHRRV
jgi:predicted kinase